MEKDMQGGYIKQAIYTKEELQKYAEMKMWASGTEKAGQRIWRDQRHGTFTAK